MIPWSWFQAGENKGPRNLGGYTESDGQKIEKKYIIAVFLILTQKYKTIMLVNKLIKFINWIVETRSFIMKQLFLK